jgi:hypothetical protein
MPKTLTELRSLARSHTAAALNVLVGIMNREDANLAARLSAANSLLDRGWGKATQPDEDGEDGPPQIRRVEHVIVRPASSNR